MFNKGPIVSNRVRKITGSFGYIEHRFLRNGFFKSLSHTELALYIFLILAADQFGVSYYGEGKITSILNITSEEYTRARKALIQEDLIAFDGRQFQVLSLPDFSEKKQPARKYAKRIRQRAPVSLKEVLKNQSGGDSG